MKRNNKPEKGDLDKVVGPPHSRRLHQVPPEHPSPSKSQHLCLTHQKKSSELSFITVHSIKGRSEKHCFHAFSRWKI